MSSRYDAASHSGATTDKDASFGGGTDALIEDTDGVDADVEADEVATSDAVTWTDGPARDVGADAPSSDATLETAPDAEALDSKPDISPRDFGPRPDVNPIVPSDGLALYLAFEDGQSNPNAVTVTDGSGKGKNGTVMGGATFVDDGALGWAIRLNGVGQYVELPQGIFNGMTAATVACWYRVYTASPKGTYSASWMRVFDLGSGVDTWWYFAPLSFPTGTETAARPRAATMFGGRPLDVFGGAPAVGNEWHHVAVVFTADQKMLLFQDGALTGTGDVGFDLSGLADTTQNWIGRSQFSDSSATGGRPDPEFHGDVDEFRIYSRALTSDEILSLAWQGH